MRTLCKLMMPLMALVLLSSFTDKDPDIFIGTLGVSASDPSQIKLTIREDHTFSYQDFSNPDQKLMVEGYWTKKGKKVILRSHDATVKFPDTWTISDHGQVGKARQGFCFYRLCKID